MALAIGVVGFALVVLIGMLATGLKTNKVSADEVNASGLAYNIWSDLKHSPSANSNGNALSARLSLLTPLSVTQNTTQTYVMNPDGTMVTSSSGTATQANATPGNTAYQVTMQYAPSGAYQTPVSNKPAIVSVTIAWPANAHGYSEGSWVGVMTFPQPQAQNP